MKIVDNSVHSKLQICPAVWLTLGSDRYLAFFPQYLAQTVSYISYLFTNVLFHITFFKKILHWLVFTIVHEVLLPSFKISNWPLTRPIMWPLGWRCRSCQCHRWSRRRYGSTSSSTSWRRSETSSWRRRSHVARHSRSERNCWSKLRRITARWPAWRNSG